MELDSLFQVGGYCWITAANQHSKLQTEFGPGISRVDGATTGLVLSWQRMVEVITGKFSVKLGYEIEL